MNNPLASYVPKWLLARLRERALLPGESYALEGVVLYADLAGFTSLTESMVQRGPLGGEVLNQILNTIFGTLVDTVYAFGGDVAWFAGDAVTAFWPLYEGESAEPISSPALRAVAAAQAIQTVMHRFSVPMPSRDRSLAMRVGLGCGELTLMVVGDEQQRRFLFTGAGLERAIVAEKHAPSEQILLHESVRRRVGAAVACDEDGWFLGLNTYVSPSPPSAPLPVPTERLLPFVHPALAERIEGRQGGFLADFRHGLVPMFVSFRADNAREIQGYVYEALGIVSQHGGYLSEVEVGDKGNVLLILFGAPLSLGDHCARAAACALDLAELPGTRAVGATSGTLFAGVVGSERRKQYTATGDEMNLAARLMQRALEEGEEREKILVSARVKRMAGPRFVYGERRELAVRGRREPVAVVPLEGRIEQWENWLRPWIGQGDLIGRDKELQQIEDCIAQAWVGRGQVLTVEGEAGVGKSHLVGELLRRWLLRGGAAYVGTCPAAAQHSPYYAWGELLRGFFELRGDKKDVERVEEMLRRKSSEWVARLPLLSDVLGLGLADNELTSHFGAQLRQELTQALLVDLLRERSEARPLLLLLEDAHWMDRLSWKVTSAVARAIQERRVLLCLVRRPRAKGALPLDRDRAVGIEKAWEYGDLNRLPHHTRIQLQELSSEDTLALACAQLGAKKLPEELGQLICKKAQGHPFFTQEIVNALREGGVIGVKNRHVLIKGDLDVVELPDTVQGVVQVRIDQLDERARLTLKVASVIGRTFMYQILRDVHPAAPTEAGLRADLDLLERLNITPLQRPEPELTYVFKHAITQEVTYHTLSYAQRRELHRAVVQWYERQYGNAENGSVGHVSPELAPYLPLLVHHYHHAGDLERERAYARRAGEQAAARYANEEALNYLSRALELTEEQEWAQRYELLLARQKIYDLQGARKAQRRDLATLETLADALDDGRRAQLALGQAHYAESVGDYAAAIAQAQAAVELAQTAGDARLEAAGHLQWSGALQRLGQYEAAQTHIEAATKAAKSAGSRQGEANSLRHLGIVIYRQGDYEGAKAAWKKALHIYREIGDRRGEGMALNNLSVVYHRQGDTDEAQKYNEQALRLRREIGDRRGEANSLLQRGIFASDYRDFATAIDCYQRALQIVREIGDRLGQSMLLNNLGLVMQKQGDLEAAAGHYEQALSLYREIRDRRGEASALSNVGQLLDKLGQYAASRACLEQALELYRALGHRRGEARGLSNLSLLLHHLGDHESAREHGRQAQRIARELGSRETLAFALTHVAHALVSFEQWDDAVALYRQALSTWQELHRPDLAAESLAGQARAFLAHGERAQAQLIVQEVLGYLEKDDLWATEEPLRVYLTCYRVLQAGRDPRAAQVLNAAHRQLQAAAARIQDRETRRSFLNDVVAHREILRAFERQNDPSRQARSLD